MLHNEKILIHGQEVDESTVVMIGDKSYTLKDIKICVYAYEKKKEARQRRYAKHKK